MIEKIMNEYYRMSFGVINDNEDKITRSTIEYLIANGFSFRHILDIIDKSNIEEWGYLSPQSLPDELWNGLVKRDKYYYHNTLHITSKPPIWNAETLKVESEPFFMEIKANYTIENLLNYYYKTCKIDITLRDEKRDSGAFDFLLNKFKLVENEGMETLDFILTLIDDVSSQDRIITNPLVLQDYAFDTLEHMRKLLSEAKYNKVNIIKWRSENV